MKITKDRLLAEHIATTILQTGIDNGEHSRVALMLGEWPNDRQNGGLCKSALAGIIAYALRSYKPSESRRKSGKSGEGSK